MTKMQTTAKGKKYFLESLISSPEIHLLSLDGYLDAGFCIGAPHLLQNFEPRLFLAPHKGQHGLS